MVEWPALRPLLFFKLIGHHRPRIPIPSVLTLTAGSLQRQ
jgi:hypothetical protein